ncbi:MAG: hypothetical protein KAV87_35860 [Desulfobacteraceae bacterium]|nr:hypothetical protein [Desulfobacteraceae bacterium]
MEETKPIMHGRCPTCGAKMFYTANASLVLEDGGYVRNCVCENGHEFIERTILSSDSYKMPN